MESLIIYIAKASGLLALFFIAYYALLRKETFFTSNRGFLLAGLLTSALLPLVEYTKVIFIEPAKEVAMQPISTEQIQQYILMQQFMEAKPEPFTINWYYVAGVIYSIGALFFLIRFIMDFLSIRRILKGNKIVKEGRFMLIDSEKVQSPFSFFNYIVFNSAVLQSEELESIINHEKVHSRQSHSADMIISQLFCIAFWFNPFIWLYKKAISQNLEFIADAVAIKQLDDKRAYQRTLLKITLQPECIAITNHFYQSLIKKRIVMLNKKQSKRRNSWKYGIVLPALAAFMLLFQVKVVAQEKASEISTSSQEKTKAIITVEKDNSDAELAESTKAFKQDFDADVIFSDVKRNASGEITAIKVTVKDKNQSQDHYVSSANPIKPFTIELEKGSDITGNTIGFGNPNKNYITSDRISIANSDMPVKNVNTKTCTSTCTNVNTNTCTATGSTNLNIHKDALVVVNGVQQKDDKNDFRQLQLPKGQAVGNMKILSAKEAKKKYGKAGKNGAVEIETKEAPSNFAYAFGSDGDVMNLRLNMPDMENIMAIASNGVNIGMDAVANVDWQKNFAFEGISEEERREIQEEMKKAHIEIQQAMKELKADMDREAFDAKGFKDEEMKQAMKEMEQAKLQMKEAQKQLEAAEKELQKAQKEMDKKKALNKKS